MEGKKKRQIRTLKDALGRISELEVLEDRCLVQKEGIESQNEFLTHVIESLPHPFYVVDAQDYTIKMANSAARLGELSPNTTCYHLTHRRDCPCDGAEHPCPLQVVKNTREPFVVEHLHYDREGNPRNVEVHAYPIFDEKGEVVQMVEYSLDITERKKLEEELRSYAEKIKLFAYSVSHDLKNPLIGIHGLVGLLHRKYRDNLDEKGKTYCDMIEKTSEQVLALIEDINVYIKTKETPLIFENLNPGKILESIRNEFAIMLGERGVDLFIPENLPEIRADRSSFFRIFRNLIDNSLKYGGDPLTEIKVAYEKSSDFHIFSVTDNGVGIAPDEMDNIFELFKRGRSSQGKEGTGLGLGIVNEMAKKHNGRVWAESEPGHRTTIHLAISKDL